MLKNHGYKCFYIDDLSELETYDISIKTSILIVGKYPCNNSQRFLFDVLYSKYSGLPFVLVRNKKEICLLERMLDVAKIYNEQDISSSFFGYLNELINILTYSRKKKDSIAHNMESFSKEYYFYSSEAMIYNARELLMSEFKYFSSFSDYRIMAFSSAITESLTNALYHGNFNLDSALRIGGLENQKYFKKLIKIKEQDSQYNTKLIHIKLIYDSNTVKVEIEDEGPGFTWKKYLEKDFTNIAGASGRGIMMIKSLVDDVSFNEKGNKIILSMQI